jgi:manganese transport protein
MHASRSLEEVNSSVETSGKKNFWRKGLAFLGPAYLVSVGYMDPGNWATDLEGGSRYGYALIWVLVMSNIMAIVLQSLCARLGIVYKKDLAQVNRETYPAAVNFCLYILAELAIAATDLAEVIGMAIGLHLLTGLPLIWGVTITIFDTFLLLYLQKLGIRKMEAFIIGLIAIIFASFFIELYFVKPQLSEILSGLKPSLPDDSALYIAIGIIGATVMPHNLYLHSALVQTRKIGDDDASKRKALKWNFVDSAIALNLALFVNAAILILAASVFHKNGLAEVASIEDAHRLLEPLVGHKLAPILFAVALIAAGQSSTVTGTLAGQIVMEGYLHIRMNPWIRRLLTRSLAVIPAFITILIAGEDKMTDLLILSQVVLSIQLAFAVIPLIYSVSNKRMMKNFAIKPWLLVLSVLITGVILFLNIKMVLTNTFEFLQSGELLIYKVLIVAGLLGLLVLLLITIGYPLFYPEGRNVPKSLHRIDPIDTGYHVPAYNRIGLALDFSHLDQRLLAHALQQGQQHSHYLLIHVVESAGAKLLGSAVADAETLADSAQLEQYAEYLRSSGRSCSVHLGFRNRVQEITRICQEEKVDLLIMGAHGHTGLSDVIWGQTIEGVRHKVNIPVLIVN